MLDTIKATWAFLTSFTKSDWSFRDYPVRVRRQINVIDPKIAYCAQIVRWWTVTGIGPTPADAVADLEQNFCSVRKNRETMPRPGTTAPVEFATTELIDAVSPTLITDFLEHVLDYDQEDRQLVFVSDESSLWDFSGEADLSSHYDKILERYGVDARDCDGAKLHEILQRIATKSEQ